MNKQEQAPAVGDKVLDYCELCGKLGVMVLDEHPELGFMPLCPVNGVGSECDNRRKGF